MNEKDLRIGNLLHDRENRLCKVEEISSIWHDMDKVKAPAIHGGITGLPNKPIELTEEWLVKFGFEKYPFNDKGKEKVYMLDEGWQLTEYKGYLVRFTADKSVEGSFNMYESYPLCHIKYVHQLQNLFFALIGNELIIK